jgi:ribosomal protein S18 acetylase RimI-like enzyme
LFRRATAADAPRVADIAERTFRATFAKYNTPEDMDLLCRSAYGEAVQKVEIEDADRETWLLESGGNAVGYFMLRRSPPPTGVMGSSPIELLRLYLDSTQQGTGNGRRLIEFALDRCRAMGGDAAWLGVWERNLNAIGFYERLGFTTFGSHIFMVGSDPQNDLLMHCVI